MFESKRNKAILIGFITVLVVLNLYKFLLPSEDIGSELETVSDLENQNVPQRKRNLDTVKSQVSLAWLKPVESAETERDLFTLDTYGENPDVPAQTELKPLEPVETIQRKTVRPTIDVVAVTSSSGNATALIRRNSELISVVKGSLIEEGYIVEKIENGKVYLKSVK